MEDRKGEGEEDEETGWRDEKEDSEGRVTTSVNSLVQ